MMKRIISFVIALLITLSAGTMNVAPVFAENTTEAHSEIYYRGVNLSGPESRGSVLPGVEGTDYTFGAEKSYEYFERKGFDIARLPILWERLQPTLSQPFNESYLNGVKKNAQWAEKHNMKIIIDIHNYGKYRGEFIGIEGSSVTVDNYADLWSRLSAEFKGHNGVYAYDIMNEPIFEDYTDWHTASQAAVDAIRANEDDKLIFVEGNTWAHSENWVSKNGEEPWINDPYDNTTYSAHCYFDTDKSGTYKLSFDEQLKATPNLLNIGLERVKEFGEWCKKYNLKGYIGEYGAPYRDDSLPGSYVESTKWSQVLDNFLTAIDSYGMDATVWSAGYWWGNGNILNVYPQNSHMDPLTGDSVHMSTFTKHLSNKEDYSLVKFGTERTFEGEYAVIDGDGTRRNSPSVSNGRYVSLPASASLDFCRINTENDGDAILRITYMARQDTPKLNVIINDNLVKEITLEMTTGFMEYETIISMSNGKNSIVLTAAENSSEIFIDKISITPLKTPQMAFTAPVDADIIKLYYSSQEEKNIIVKINDSENTVILPSTNGKGTYISCNVNITKGDAIEVDDGSVAEVSLLNTSSIKADGKTALDLPISIDQYSSVVVQRNTADFNNNDDEIWGYKGYDGNMKNWNVEKQFHDGSQTNRYYRTSFEETGTYGTMKSAHMNLPLCQGNMWELSDFKYVTMDLRSNTDVSIRLYQNGANTRETNSGITISDTKGNWTTVKIPIEAFMSDWLYNDFTRTTSRTNYVIFYPAYTEGGSTYRYFDVDNISFNWTDKQVGITSINFTNETDKNINASGLTGGITKLTATVKNTKDLDNDTGDFEVVLLFALFDRVTGSIVDINASSQVVKSNTGVEFKLELDVPDNFLDRYETKTFLWEKNTLQPITEVYKF